MQSQARQPVETTLSQLDGRVGWRLLWASVLAMVAETGVRAAVAPSAVVGAGELARDAVVRFGRIAIVAGGLAVVLLATLHTLGARRAPRLAAATGRWVARLLRPACALRLTLLYVAAAVALRLTLARDYDFAWHVAWLLAVMALLPGLAAELWLGRRGRAGSVRSQWLGRLLWTGLLAFIGFAQVSRPPQLWPAAIATLAVWALVVPVPRIPARRAARVALALVVLAAVPVALWLEATEPSLRRYAGQHTPVSNAGLRILLGLTDLDRDGASGWLGLDCDDADGRRYPAADDPADDGLDQNCTGSDARLETAIARTHPGQPRAPWEPGPPRPRDIVLVTLDAMRADVLFGHGARPSLLPDTLGQLDRCIRFTQARAQGSFTNPSILALFTAMQPRHLMRNESEVMITPADFAAGRLSIPPALPSSLRVRQGYQTEAVLAGGLGPVLSGLGWERVTALAHGGDFAGAQPVLSAARGRLEALDAVRPWLLWVHLADLHAPYLGGSTRAAYEEAAAGMDGPLASFLADLPRDAILIVTADHGETFGEHGWYAHGYTGFEDELHVPVALCAPPDLGLGPAREVATPIGLIDLVPTLLELVGGSYPYPFHGESLVAHLRSGAPLQSPWVLSEERRPYTHVQTLLVGCHKWMRDLALEWEALFDVCADPDEHDDLSAREPEAMARLRGEYFEVLDDDLEAFRSWRAGRQVAGAPGLSP